MDNQYYFANTRTYKVGATDKAMKSGNGYIVADNKYELCRYLSDYIHGVRISTIDMIKKAENMSDVRDIINHHDLTISKLDAMIAEVKQLDKNRGRGMDF
ncbi:hypothetical protein AAEX37_01094 [Oligella sp. MSHR50489EDL]|uniref:hypothetical protein n=1 Tax=Oligella sp. MSHR50489EDL TaxID=3139409 RepID=UPI003D81C153